MTRRKQALRVLAIAPSYRGFGYAVIEEPFELVDWGVKSVSKDKSARSITKVEEAIAHYKPRLLVVPDVSELGCRRAVRVKNLIQDITKLTEARNVEVHTASQKEIQEYFFNTRPATKHELAVLLATRFPDELGARLPPKRRPWMSEDYRMDIFAAVALAVTGRWKQARRRSKTKHEVK